VRLDLALRADSEVGVPFAYKEAVEASWDATSAKDSVVLFGIDFNMVVRKVSHIKSSRSELRSRKARNSALMGFFIPLSFASLDLIAAMWLSRVD